ncbi:MAG: hypothetical protein A3H96_06000 [Acidobacteria bacterium RIFCSPLOWO2_02_FULL_67_36]|nr:MAG: hypothetical protein A3H96_06000 [Acidobacteria bacterium RIFCSPLOWO2_02_FULL_67_36]OFW20188.1 MAG: hypothetical protein A3G21_26310 [Acidobacteria bacterium RIFCSPLOWO2_12_FULL_66_21]
MTGDPLLRRLERLPPAGPDAARAERVRTRCHKALARQAAQRPSRPPAKWRRWEPALIGGLCLAYLTEVLHEALHLYGLS